jgi:hypothetical protein
MSTQLHRLSQVQSLMSGNHSTFQQAIIDEAVGVFLYHSIDRDNPYIEQDKSETVRDFSNCTKMPKRGIDLSSHTSVTCNQLRMASKSMPSQWKNFVRVSVRPTS